jgi:hypothetical protein
MARTDPDDMLVVLFKTHAFENQDKTKKEGRPIYDDCEICEIRAPGSKDVKVFLATDFSHWQDNPLTGQQHKVSYAERFRHQYQQFKAQATQTKSGTPLEFAKFLSEGRRAELRAQNVYTIEQLALIEGAELKNLGPQGREFKNQAIEYIEDSRQSAPNKQLEAELEALRARNAVLEDDVSLLRSARARQESEFDEMSDEQLRDYITAHSGRAPHGTLPRKSLKRMAIEATAQDKVA